MNEMEYGYEETKESEDVAIEVEEDGSTEILEVESTEVVVNSPVTESSIENNDTEMKTNEVTVDTGVHFYGETVSQPITTSSMLDFIGDIIIEYSRGNLPKSSPEETAELLRKWFDKSILQDVQSEFHEQPVTPIESSAEQCIRNVLKRPRIDSEF